MWMLNRIWMLVPCALLAICMVACTQWAEPDVSPFKNDPLPRRKGISAPVIHKVQFEGETLSIISQWYTGRVRNWRILAQINSEVDPFHIPIGQQILIPPSLVYRSDPLPRLYVQRFYESGKAATVKPKRTPAEKAPAVADKKQPPKPKNKKPAKIKPATPIPSPAPLPQTPEPAPEATQTVPTVPEAQQPAVQPAQTVPEEPQSGQPYFLPSSPELEPVGPKL